MENLKKLYDYFGLFWIIVVKNWEDWIKNSVIYFKEFWSFELKEIILLVKFSFVVLDFLVIKFK